jgi:uncharacterized protein YgiM (DUF1202 family)
MLLKRWYGIICPGVILCLLSLAACSSIGLGTETAYVVSQRMTLLSSTAKVSKTVGELKNGDKVTILERLEEGGRSWARLRGAGGETGWADARFLVSEDVVESLRRLSEEVKDIPAQAIAESKSYLKLRLSPDRSSDDNAVTRLSAGTIFEIIERERKPRPASLENKTSAGSEDNEDKDTEQKFDDWFKVRVKDNQVLPAGWVYGGSLQLNIPDEISYYASSGRRITGWQKIGTVTDAGGRSGGAYLMFEKEIYPDDKDRSGKEDFDRIQVISWDAGRRDYFTPVRENIRGRFPVIVKTEGSRSQFQIKELDQNENLQTRVCSIELASDGKVTVTGLKAQRQKK